MASYARARQLLATGTLGWTTTSTVFRCLLVAPSYVYSAYHATVADILAHEVDAPSYSRATVTGRSVVPESAGQTLFRCEPVTFPELSGVVIGGAVVYRRVGPDDSSPSNDDLVLYHGFDPITCVGQDLQFVYDVAAASLTSS